MIGNIDLQRPLTDHPIWKDVRGVWLPGSNTAGGDTLYDLSPYGNHGMLNGMDPATDWVATDRGLALDFDGVGGYVDLGVASKSIFTGSSGATIVVVVQTVSTAIERLIGSYNGQNPSVVLGINTTASSTNSPGYVEFFLRQEIATWNSLIASTSASVSINDGHKHHIVVTADLPIKNIKIYIDGISSAVNHTSTTITTTTFKTLAYNILHGANNATGVANSFLTGISNGISVFERVFSPNEVAIFYDQSLRGYPDLIRRVPTRRYFFPPNTKPTKVNNIFDSIIINSS